MKRKFNWKRFWYRLHRLLHICKALHRAVSITDKSEETDEQKEEE